MMTDNARQTQILPEELERLIRLMNAANDNALAIAIAFAPVLEAFSRSMQEFGVCLANWVETLSDEERLLLGIEPKDEEEGRT